VERATIIRPRGEIERWLHPTVLEQLGGRSLRLFCFAHAGAGASQFRDWQAHVTGNTLICPVQLPGREARWKEEAFTSMDSLAQTLAAAFTPVLDVPFALFGHSMGGLIVFELARQLRRMGLPMPGALIVSATQPPHLPPRMPPIHHLPDHDFLRELTVRLNGIPREVLDHPEMISALLPTLRADVQLCETYKPAAEAPFDIPIAAYGGRDDAGVVYDDVVNWSVQTRGRFRFHMFKGDHFFLTSDAGTFFTVLETDLARALAGQGKAR
jgi:medium-chain acyl-[acyl-carrier-protein] hydrolase